MKRICFIIVIIIFLCDLPVSHAQQTSFQVSSPPVPWYEFSKGQKDVKLSGTFLYLTGEIDSAQAGGDVNVYGGGLNSFYRYALRDKFAFDIGGAVLGAGGNIGNNASMNMTMLSLPFDLEFQPVKTNRFAIILFGGFNFTWMYLGVDYNYGSDSYAFDIWSSMRGPQGGIQVAVKYPDFVFTPFFMITSLSGDADIDITANGKKISTSSGIPSTTAYYYGIDIIYLPGDITLSSILQQAMSNGDNQGYKTYVFSISYHFSIEDGENSIEVPPEEKETVKRKKRPVKNNKQIQQ